MKTKKVRHDSERQKADIKSIIQKIVFSGHIFDGQARKKFDPLVSRTKFLFCGREKEERKEEKK